MNREKTLKFAFTMAETLLTMFIIGVIAVFMLKSVNRITPSKDKVMFLRSFHAIEKAAAEAATDTSLYDSDKEEDTDLASTPLPNARVSVQIGNSTVTMCPTTSPYTDCTKKLTNLNAPCYFIAEKLNTTGSVNCSTEGSSNLNNVLNFRTANGVCFYGLAGRRPPFDFIIDPDCKGVAEGYAARLLPSGNMTVPQTSVYDNSGGADVKFEDKHQQKRAYQWMLEQTDVKKKTYEFEKEEENK